MLKAHNLLDWHYFGSSDSRNFQRKFLPIFTILRKILDLLTQCQEVQVTGAIKKVQDKVLLINIIIFLQLIAHNKPDFGIVFKLLSDEALSMGYIAVVKISVNLTLRC